MSNCVTCKLCWIALAIAFAVFLAVDCDFYLYFMPFRLEDKGFDKKVIWVTGASSGIGAYLAKDLVKSGAHVIISARREDKLNELANECRSFGIEPFVQPLDVTDTEKMSQTVTNIINKFGRIDSVVLNAGRSQRAIAVETSMEETKGLMDLNFFSYVSLTKEVLPHMIKQGGGQLVIMSSVSGRLATPIASTYSASKFALHGYYDALRAEVSIHNISVSIVCPGPVESEISEHTIRSKSTPKTTEGKKMPTARCSYLVAKGMFYKVDEMWISQQPFLLITYFNTYFPWLSRQIFTGFLGPKRMELLKKGGNIYDVAAVLGLK